MSKQHMHVLAVIGPGSPESRGLWREIKEQKDWLAVAVMPQDADSHGLVNPPDRGGWDAIITASEWDAGLLIRLLSDADGIIGDEGSISLADEVAAALHMPHDDPETSILRYNKAAMTRMLQQKGLPVPTTFHATSIAEARDAAKTIGYPLVVKLPASCAGDHFTICKDVSELEASWQQILGQRSILGDVIDSALVQERLTGPVCSVNSITLAPGEHWILDVWRDIHFESGAAYDRSDLLDSNDPHYESLIKRANEAMDAVGLNWGPSHIEMMQNAAGEWAVIDLAARPAGWYPRSIRLAADVVAGPNQTEATVLAVTDPDELRRRLTNRTSAHGKVTLLYMIVPRDDVVIDAVVLDSIFKLPGVRGAIGIDPGIDTEEHLAQKAISKTTSLINQVAAVDTWCIAGPPETVEATVKKVRELEQSANGLYRKRSA